MVLVLFFFSRLDSGSFRLTESRTSLITLTYASGLKVLISSVIRYGLCAITKGTLDMTHHIIN